MNPREAESHESPSAPAVPEASGSVPARLRLWRTKRPVLSATADEWRSWMVERGYPAYRARQVLDWVIRRRAESFERMSDLPKPLRHRLDAEWTVFGTRAAYHDVAPDGTDKLVVACRDGRRIECVLMAEGPRRTVCISTQVGCGMGCVFCASGLKGVERNLTSDEILEQVFHLRNLLPPEETISHIVVMGMGESLANLDNLARGARSALLGRGGAGDQSASGDHLDGGAPREDPQAGGDGSAVPPGGLAACADRGLAQSIWCRSTRRSDLSAVLAAADAYFEKTGRQVTYEYVLLGGVNDRAADAQALGRLLMARRSHVNLIPYNPVAGLSFARPEPEAIDRFVAILRGRGVSVTVRKTKGRAIDAACGQLRRRLDQEAAATIRSRGRCETAARADGCSRRRERDDRSRFAGGRTPGESRGREPGAATRRRVTRTSGSWSRSAPTCPGPSSPWSKTTSTAWSASCSTWSATWTRPRISARRPSCGSTRRARATDPGPSSRPGCSRSPTTWR